MSTAIEILRKTAPMNLDELSERLRDPLESAGAEKAIAFGSFAEGRADGYSDLDLVVVVDTDLPFLERGRLLPEIFDAVPIGVDLLIYTPEELRRGLKRPRGIFAEIADHGTTIYEGSDVPRNEARRWLDSAREDLEYARHAAKEGFHAPACFHAQRAAERAIKAMHYQRGARVVIGHNVRNLIEALDPGEQRLRELLDPARELDLFYIATRYPNGLDAGTPGEAFSETQSSRALELAKRFVTVVSESLEG